MKAHHKDLLYLLEGDIKSIKTNHGLTDEDEIRVKEMQMQLLGDKGLLKKLGWGRYSQNSRVLQAKTYILAMENYVSLKKSNSEKGEEHYTI